MEIEPLVDTARRAVAAACEPLLQHFGRGIATEMKADNTPVTLADRAAEASILEVLIAAHPDHSILSEESGAHAGDPRRRWIVDPLDGTRGYSRGGPFWGPLVAFALDGEVIAGAMALPALGESYWAGRGLGCYQDGSRLAVSTVSRWDAAILNLGELSRLLSAPHGEAVRGLMAGAASVRCYGDLAALTPVLKGQAEVWLETGVKPWDLAPAQILLAEAGGKFTDFAGQGTYESGSAVGSNGRLHQRVLAALRDVPPT
jgi:histidinol-phosphatase